MKVRPSTLHSSRRAFTLIELVMGIAASAVILAAIYGVFSKAVHLRDNANKRTRAMRVQSHSASVLREDLRNAIVSGGTLAATLKGSNQSYSAGFPGYLKFTTTTGRELDVDDTTTIGSAIQQVEYYINADADAPDRKAGRLVRSITRDILSSVQQTPVEELLMPGLESMEVSFYDGTTWQESWEVTTDNKTLPEAVRVRLQPVTPIDEAKPAAIEILVPWTTKPAIEATPTTTEGGGQ